MKSSEDLRRSLDKASRAKWRAIVKEVWCFDILKWLSNFCDLKLIQTVSASEYIQILANFNLILSGDIKRIFFESSLNGLTNWADYSRFASSSAFLAMPVGMISRLIEFSARLNDDVTLLAIAISDRLPFATWVLIFVWSPVLLPPNAWCSTERRVTLNSEILL